MAGGTEERGLGWALVTPALAFTTLFFVLPFIAMAAVSLTSHETGGVSLGNYMQFVLNQSYRQAMVNSLEVTLFVTAISIVARAPSTFTILPVTIASDAGSSASLRAASTT